MQPRKYEVKSRVKNVCDMCDQQVKTEVNQNVNQNLKHDTDIHSNSTVNKREDRL